MSRGKQIKVRVSDEEYGRMEAAAEREGMFLAAWMRRVAVMHLNGTEDMGIELERVAERRVERDEPYVPPVAFNEDIPEELPQKPLTRKAELEERRRKHDEEWAERGYGPVEEGQSDLPEL